MKDKHKEQAEAQDGDGLGWPVCTRADEVAQQLRGDKMKREIAYFCPQCQSNELTLGSVMDIASSVSVSCALCKWSGRSNEVVGAVSPANAQFWNAEKIGNVMLIAMAKHGAGPLIQVLELMGILPPIPGSIEGITTERAEEAQSAQECRDRVMQAVVGAAVTAAFETAAEVSASHYARYNPEQGAAVDKVFQFSGTGDQNVH
jgi:hypothetical protein